MARPPVHRRPKDRFRDAQLAPVKRPRLCKCAHPLVRHEERIGGQLVQGPCTVPLCGCTRFRETT